MRTDRQRLGRVEGAGVTDRYSSWDNFSWCFLRQLDRVACKDPSRLTNWLGIFSEKKICGTRQNWNDVAIKKTRLGRTPRPIGRQRSLRRFLAVMDRVSLRVSSRNVSRHVMYTYLSWLSLESRHIHVLSWLESRSSMSRLGSVSWLSWCVLAQCVLRSWHNTVWALQFCEVCLSLVDNEARPVYLTVYLFTVDQ